jgi:tetraacyldisaccharide 4'-kinase
MASSGARPFSRGLRALIRPGWRSRVERRLQRLWFAPHGPIDRMLGGLLWPLHRLVAWVAAGRRRRIAQARALPRPPAQPPVVVVGNLVVGGTGKTPLLIALVQALQARGWRPGVLARGYAAAAAAGPARRVSDGDDPAQVGDEPLLVARRTGVPVVAGRDRAEALRLLLSGSDCTVVLSDDGLQHVGLRRDIELAVFDGRGAGNRRCLPAGPLREPLSGALLMDAVILNGEQVTAPLLHSRTFRFHVAPTAFVALAGERQWTPEAFVSELGPDAVDALAGLGSPRRFFDMLALLGVRARRHPLADHAAPDPAWLAGLPGRFLVMTEKDAVKCAAFDPTLLARCVALRVDAVPEGALVDWLEDRLRG